MDNFDHAFELTVGHEGGFTRNRKDRGNWTSGQVGKGALKGTKFGISAMSYPHLDIENLTVDEAKAIYRMDFWSVANCEALPHGLDYLHFDGSVNHGISRSAKFIQEAVGAVPDGVIGPKTLKRVNQRETLAVIKEYSVRRGLFYADLRTFDTFGLGWFRRLIDTTVEAVELYEAALDNPREGEPEEEEERGWYRRIA